jgi:DNA-binding IclR family transcriptional regulator
VDRAIDVLETMARSGAPMTLGQLTRVNVAGPIFRMQRRYRELAAHVMLAARAISAELGWDGAARPAT